MNWLRNLLLGLFATMAICESSLQSAAANIPDNSALDRSLLRDATQLDQVALHLRNPPPKQKNIIPVLHLPPANLGSVPVYTPSLDEWLRANLVTIQKEKDYRTQRHELHLLAASLRRMASRSSAFPLEQDPNDVASSVLAQAAYRSQSAGPAPPPKQTLWEKFLSWLGRLLGEIFGRIFQGASAVPLLGQILAVVFVLMLIAGIAAAVYALLPKRGKKSSADFNEGEALAEQADPDKLYQLGIAAASAGQYARAIALLFQASLAAFDRAGKLQYDPSLTAGEYRRAVKRSVSVASPHFDILAKLFVIAAYARLSPSAGDWFTAQQAFLALRPLVAT